MGPEKPVSMEKRSALRIAVIGGGPIGLEAALYGATQGHHVTVFEQGELGDSVRRWGHVAMFSPWHLNTTTLGRETLARAGHSVPDPMSCPTGHALVEQYLLPLGESDLLRDCLRLQHTVLSISRPGLLKGDLIGKAERGAQGFVLTTVARDGTEATQAADVVLDCSGTFLQPQALGDGGVPAVGERALGKTGRIWRHVPDLLGQDRSRFLGRRVLVVGSGNSAATAIAQLAQLAGQDPHRGPRVVWATRRPSEQPFAPRADDPLPSRRDLWQAANAAVTQQAVRWLPGWVVSQLSEQAHSRPGEIMVTLRNVGGAAHAQGDECMKLPVDEILSLTGYGPDRSLYEQLQVHECYASAGPMKLAASLLSAGSDCMAQPAPGPETLRNPEPRFFILGAKSYGKNSAFLLSIGHAQIRAVFSLLAPA